MTRERDQGPVERVLSLFADVRRGEALTATLLALDVFLLLFAYYLLKVTRESIVGMPHGPQMKAYAAAAMAVLLLPLLKAYELVSERVGRFTLIASTTGFFIVCLIVFALLATAGAPVGFAFYVWVGIFNLFVVAQIWSFANDVHTEERGRRLFPLVAIGSCAGAVVGSLLAKRFDAVHPAKTMIVAGVLLVVALAATYFVHTRMARETADAPPPAPLARGGGLRLLFRERYLVLIAATMVVYNCVNTLGEFVLDTGIVDAAHAAHADPRVFAASFRGDFYAIVNGLSWVVQLLFVSRILQKWGVRGALFVMPVVSLLGYVGIAATLGLFVMKWAKIAENTVDYSLQSTTRQALFLVTTREQKYKVKALIDTFFVRIGDVVAAALVWVGTELVRLGPRGFALVNVVLVAVWMSLAWGIAREHRRKSVAA